MEIMIFKTSITAVQEVNRVKPLLAIPAIKNWNFDLEDCDKILRVVAERLSPRHIESILQSAGFNCEELPY